MVDTADIGLASLTAAGLGSAALGHKAVSDADRAKANLNRFADISKDLGPQVNKPNFSFEDAEQVLREYTARGRDLSATKVLGIPVGKVLQYGRPAVEGEHLINVLKGMGASVVRRDLKPLWDRLKEYDTAGRHYKMYTEPGHTMGAYRKHHLVDIGIPDEFNHLLNETGGRDLSIFDDKAMQILNDEGNTFESMVNKLRAAKRDAAANIVSATVLGGKHGPYEAQGMIKRLITGHPGHEAYVNRYKAFGDAAHKYVHGGGKTLRGLGLLGAGLGAGMLTAKNASLKTALDEREMYGAAAGGTGLGALALGLGSYNAATVKDNPNIAVTYGEMPAIGSGHKAPADSIIKILQNAKMIDPRLKDINIERVARDAHGVMQLPKQKEYALNINTGFGDSLYPGQASNPEIGGQSFAIPKGQQGTNILPVGQDLINARKDIAYQSDINPYRKEFGTHFPQTPTYLELLRKHITQGKIPNFDVLAYGPDPAAAGMTPNLGTIHNLTEGASPAIDPDTVKAIMEDTRTHDEVLDEAAKYYETTAKRPDFLPDDAARKTLADQLRSIKGKQLITIAGSGRGDFVGSRARDLMRAIQANPQLKDKYALVALLADGYRDQAKLLEGLPNTVGLGRVDKNLYNALQNRAHLNWGSTGASALAEGLHHNSILALPERWGTGDVSGIVGKHRDAMREINGPFTNKAMLDEWNRGGIQYAHQQPGVLKANSAEDIVAALLDPSRINTLREGALARRANSYSLFQKGQKNLVDVVAKLMHEQNAGIRAKALPRGLAGLGLAGLTGLLGYKATREPTLGERLRNMFNA